MKRRLAWGLFILSVIGLTVTFPMWLTGNISDRAMLGITLALSWLALLYEAIVAITVADEAEAD